MTWIIEDIYGVGGNGVKCGASGQAGNSGELRNPDFPAEVGATESWTGTIDAVNVGETRDKFRIKKNGAARSPFELDPEESRTESFSGTGPAEFNIVLERWAVEAPWYRKYAKELMIVSVAGVVGVVIATRK